MLSIVILRYSEPVPSYLLCGIQEDGGSTSLANGPETTYVCHYLPNVSQNISEVLDKAVPGEKSTALTALRYFQILAKLNCGTSSLSSEP